MNALANVTRDTLNAAMEIDHVIRVHADGTVTDLVSGIWAPSLYDGDLSQMAGHDWRLMDGYSGQYMYAGPVMHPSEYIGGRMADDILSTPGYYVAIVADYPCADHAGECGCDTVDGWAVAYMPIDEN